MNEIPKVKPWEPQQRFGSLKTWTAKHEAYLEQTKKYQGDIKVVFIGDSLTELFLTEGKLIWDRYYAPTGAFNYGIYADTTSNILWRIQHGELDTLKPKLIVFQAGYNNLFDPESTVEDMVKGMTEIVKELTTKFAESKILVLSLIPLCDQEDNDKTIQFDQLVQELDNQKNIFYLNIRPGFVDSDGVPIDKLRKRDKVHFTRAGYRVWHNQMWPLYSQLIQ